MLNGERTGALRADVRSIFDPSRFALPRLPVPVGMVDADGDLRHLPACLDMPVMLPGGDVVLPDPYRDDPAVASFMRQCLSHQDGLLPGWRATRHLYLTVDTRRVLPGATHRNAGWHFDGMQGARYPIKLPACHQYLACTALPTLFSSHPVDASGLDELRHNWFEALGDQVPPDHEGWSPKPCGIVCMSAYQLHRSPTSDRDRWRTFLRLDVSCKQQDRLGNTPNPSLPVPFAYVPRSLPEGLSRPIRDSSWDRAMRLTTSSIHNFERTR